MVSDGAETRTAEIIPREHFPRSIFARMSLEGREEIGRVERVGRGCYEDPREDVRNKSCACRARKILRTTRHTEKRAELHRSRQLADQSGKREDVGVSGVSARMSRGSTRGNCFH